MSMSHFRSLARALSFVAALGLVVGSSCVSAGTYAPIIFYNIPNWYGNYWEYIRYPSPEAAATVEWEARNPPVCPPPLPSSNNYYVYDHIEPIVYPPGSNEAYYYADAFWKVYYRFHYCNTGTELPPAAYASSIRRYIWCSPGIYYYHFGNMPTPGVCGAPAVDTPKNLGPCPNCGRGGPVGNPINPGTGNKYHVQTEYSGSGPFPLTFTWAYNSARADGANFVEDKPLGEHRSHNYSSRVRVTSSPAITTAWVSRPDGKTYRFNQTGANWVADADVSDRLVPVLNGSSAIIGWQYTRADDDAVENYDASGVLASVTSRDGSTHTLAYTSGKLASVTDDFGRQLAFAYDTSGRIAAMTDPAMGQTVFAYDANKNLLSVTYPDTKVRTYKYEVASYPNALTGIVDENNVRFATYGYDTSGRANSTEHAGVNRHTIDYATSKVTDPLLTQRTNAFSNVLGVTRLGSTAQPCSTPGCTGTKSESRIFDANGNVTQLVDFNGNKTCFAYDTARNLETTRVVGLGTSAVCSTALTGSLTAPARRITTTWHATFRLPATITEPTTAGNRVTTFTRDAQGNVLSKSVAVGGQTRTWSWTYDAFGRVLTATDPRNKTTTNTHYANNAGQGTKRGMLYTVTNAANHTTTITDYNGHGQPLSITDANGLVTTISYDARQRLRTRTVGGELTIYDYDNAGQLITVTLPDSSTLTYSYDAAHRLYEITDTLGNKVTYNLDNLGNRLSESYKDPTGALARTRSRVYDSLNRLYQDIGGATPATQITQFGYDDNGNQTTTTDPLGRVTSQSYDALNRLLQVVDPFNGSTAPTKYEYDDQDNLTKVTDPKNLATIYGYSGFNELLNQSSPDTGTTSFTYDVAGNLQTKTDARGVITTYTYDDLNRVATISYPAYLTDPAETVTYTYDSCANGKGRLCSVADKTGTTNYAYNLLGRVTSKSQTVSGLIQTISYGYNSAGQLISVTYPSGAVIGYGYLNNRITSVTINGITALNQADYEPFGPVGEWYWGNSTPQVPNKHTRYFDLDGRNTKIESTAGLEPTVLVYDAASRITALQKLTAGSVDTSKSNSYSYDSLDRLTSVTPGAGNSDPARGFTYDGVGNRLTATVASSVTNYSYGATSHRLNGLSGATTNTYGYDAAGNRATDSAATWTYGGNNRPIQVVAGGNTTTFGINALGQRVKKTTGANVVRFVYDEAGRLIGEYDNAGTRITETVWFNDLPVAVMK